MPTQDLCVRCWFNHLRQLEAWSLGRKKLQLASATLKVRAPARHVLKQLEGRLSLGRKTELGKVLPLPWKGSSVARHTPLKMDLWLCDICNWTFEQVYRCWCGRWVCWGCWHLRWNCCCVCARSYWKTAATIKLVSVMCISWAVEHTQCNLTRDKLRAMMSEMPLDESYDSPYEEKPPGGKDVKERKCKLDLELSPILPRVDTRRRKQREARCSDSEEAEATSAVPKAESPQDSDLEGSCGSSLQAGSDSALAGSQAGERRTRRARRGRSRRRRVEEEGEPLVKQEVQEASSESEERQKEEQQPMRKRTMSRSPSRSKSDSSLGPSRGLKLAKKELRIVGRGVGQAYRQVQGKVAAERMVPARRFRRVK